MLSGPAHHSFASHVSFAPLSMAYASGLCAKNACRMSDMLSGPAYHSFASYVSLRPLSMAHASGLCAKNACRMSDMLSGPAHLSFASHVCFAPLSMAHAFEAVPRTPAMRRGPRLRYGFRLRVALRPLASGGGGEGVFGPLVFGVADAEVFADLEVGGGPEGAEVGGDLHGFVAGERRWRRRGRGWRRFLGCRGGRRVPEADGEDGGRGAGEGVRHWGLRALNH